MKNYISFIVFLICLFLQPGVIHAQVVQDYRDNYRQIPVYAKTVQFLVSHDQAGQHVFIRQNLDSSTDPVAYVIPFKFQAPVVSTATSDPFNLLLEKYSLNHTYGEKQAEFLFEPKLYTASTKDELFSSIKKQNFALDMGFQTQLEQWLQEGASVLFIAVKPVTDAFVTWTPVIKIDSQDQEAQLPIIWLRNGLGKLTTNTGKILYAENFEGGAGGWVDEYQGQQANSLVTRDTGTASEGSYALRVTNKPGSINAVTSQTIGGLHPGERYTFSAYFNGGNSHSGSANLRIMGAGLIALSSDLPLYVDQTKKWQRVSVSFVARTNYHTFSLLAGGTNPNEYVNWDAIQIEKGDTATAFRSDLVGKTLDTLKLTEMGTSAVHLQMLFVDDVLRTTRDPLFQTLFYKVKNASLPEIIGNRKFSYISYLNGQLNPDNSSAYFTTVNADEKDSQLFTLESRNVGVGKIVNNMGFLDIYIYVFFGVVILACIKWCTVIFARYQPLNTSNIIVSIAYPSFWLISLVSSLLLISSILTSTLSYARLSLSLSKIASIQPQIPPIVSLRPDQIFLLTLFVLSTIVYIGSVFFERRLPLLIVKRIAEIQLGILLLCFVITLSLFIMDIFSPVSYQTDQLFTIFQKMRMLPVLFVTLIESSIIAINCWKIRKHFEKNRLGI